MTQEYGSTAARAGTATTTMQAIVQDAYGEAGEVLRLEEIDRPEVDGDGVLVRSARRACTSATGTS